jgi:tetratricopeptide (TPR) repeat protein
MNNSSFNHQTLTPELSVLRSYLLGTLTSEQPAREIEERLLTEDDFLEQVNLAEDELIDAYLDGQLNDDELAAFERHFLRAVERQRKLRFSRALRKLALEHSTEASGTHGPVKPSTWFSFRNLAIAAGLLAFAIAAGAIYRWQTGRESRVDDALVALNQNFRDRRPIEPRISGLEYTRFSSTRGGSESSAGSIEIDRAELLATQAVKENSASAAAHHALGQVYLAQRKPDEAITELTRAAELDPGNAATKSDLAAAYYEKAMASRTAQSAQSPELKKCVEVSDEALRLDPRQRAALFNRALCLQNADPAAARSSWQQYLRLDPDSGWSNDARNYLSQIEPGP